MIAFKLRVYMLAAPWNCRESSQMGLLKRVAPTLGFEVAILLYDLDMMTGWAVEPLKARQQDVVEE